MPLLLIYGNSYLKRKACETISGKTGKGIMDIDIPGAQELLSWEKLQWEIPEEFFPSGHLVSKQLKNFSFICVLPAPVYYSYKLNTSKLSLW
ncbi:hypothetical protein TNCT_377691 [Trichonephila clavata]|uniref:Uncharacterized protein n=1 Tax=Trichonephila clavata TaxID=2740835 RepID=A0A8X6FME5_TRICU|nr:hypothetical protein TNCT_377691 [Trichonephila clavata]